MADQVGLAQAIEKKFASEAKIQTQLCEQVFLSSVVLWEGFVSDLFAAYVNRDHKRLAAALSRRLRDSAVDKHGDVVGRHVKVEFPKHLKKSEVYSILDADGKNLTFKSAALMIERAREWLPTYAGNRFASLTMAEQSVIDAGKAVRDFVAHRSRAAKARMNESLAKAALPVALRIETNKVHNVGAYLKARKPATGDRRIDRYLSLFAQIGASL